jgi:heptosyltransferase-3
LFELNRILVIRGGAIGDFILTLPALKALRDAYPKAHIEILGYKHIAVLAENRFYADSVRSIEYGPLASFFAKNSEPPPELASHFSSFDLVISYLYDPDKIFAGNLQHCGVKQFIQGPAKIDHLEHAARQLARPVAELGINVVDFAAKIFNSAEDRQFAEQFLADFPFPLIALHSGSGSEKKNWPLENWIELGNNLVGRVSVVFISGEADQAQIAKLKDQWKNEPVRFAENLPLPQLAAILEKAIFVGHDSGISHLAAATGANCILLFGQTDPAIWAPLNANVQIIRAPAGDLSSLSPDVVRDAVLTLIDTGLQAGAAGPLNA